MFYANEIGKKVKILSDTLFDMSQTSVTQYLTWSECLGNKHYFGRIAIENSKIYMKC